MAKLRYMVDRRAVIENGAVARYEPIGVWVHTIPNGFDVFYLAEDPLDYVEEDGWKVLNKLVEDEVHNLPSDLLEYHRDTCSAYHGARGPIVETEDFANADLCGAWAIDQIKNGRIT